MAPRLSIARKTLVGGALLAGVSIGAAGIASAATGTSSTTTPSSSKSSSSGAPSGAPPAGAPRGAPPSGAGNPATMTHGPGETLLTGSALQKADAAAKAAVPGATIIRAESDSSGASPYEVHMKKADGTYVTVQLNSNFQEVKVVSGFGAPPRGTTAPNGAPGGPGGQYGPAAPGTSSGTSQSQAAA
jgi:hypothetical protein